jgi:hypothetical protein
MMAHLFKEVCLSRNFVLLSLKALFKLGDTLVLIEFRHLVLEDSVVCALPLAATHLLIPFEALVHFLCDSAKLGCLSVEVLQCCHAEPRKPSYPSL